jgi:hypothetical protein
MTFKIVKGCKTKDYPDGNAASKPIAVPSTVKWETQFSEISLKKDQDPEVWIAELEGLRDKVNDRGSSN